MTNKSLAWCIVAASAVVWLVMAVPLFCGRAFSISDLWDFYIPSRAHYSNCLAHGDWPLWFSDLFAGYYAHGTGETAMCHPTQFLLYWFLPVYAALDLEILLAYPVMFVGMYLFLRRWSLRVDCALFGAMLFTFSTFNITRLIHPNALRIVAHFPWVLCCADIVVRGTDRRKVVWAAVGLGLLNTSELLLGYPQYFWFSSLLLAFYVALLFCLRSLTIWRAGMLAAAVGLGIAGGAVQLLPTIDALSLSVRKLSPTWPEDMAFAGSTDPRYLLQAVAPYSLNVSHKQRIYMGAVPLLLVVWAAVRWKHLGGAKPLVLAALAMAALMIWLELGEFGYLYQLQTHLPFIGNFRYPSRYVHLMSLAFAVCGAFAVADMLAMREGRSPLDRKVLWVLGGVVLASILVTALVFRQRTEQTLAFPGHVLLGPVLMALAVGLIVWTARGGRWAPAALVILAVADPAYYGISHSIWNETSQIETRLAGVSLPPEKTADRLLGGCLLDKNGASMLSWRRVDGFEGLPPFRRLDYRKPNARRVAGVGWVSNVNEEVHGFWGDYAFFDTSDMTGLTPSANPEWFSLPDPLPRARCVSKTVVADKPNEVIDSIDVATTAIVETPLDLASPPEETAMEKTGTGKTAAADASAGEAMILLDRPGKLDLRVDCPSRQLLVVSEAYHSGWQVRIDSAPAAPMLRVNGDFMGCVVEAGDHDVALVFDPPSFRRGLLVSLVGLALLALWFVAPVVLRW